MHTEENRETRDTSIRSSLEFESHGCAFTRWLPSLRVIKAGADFECGSVLLFYDDCAAHVCASASTFLVADYYCLCVFESFDFEERITPAVFVFGFWVFYHYTFTFATADFVHVFFEVLRRFTGSLTD